jgi:dTDP-4-dehydrorhamnose 3,5-epimerase-like enzyme
MTHFTLLDLPTFSDPRGALTVLDGALPFPIVRTYWIYGADGQTRGGHRHHKTRQALIAMSGTVTIFINDGIAHDDVVLDSPSRCLLVEPKHWHSMAFGPGSVLLVMASHHYDRDDYIDTKYE